MCALSKPPPKPPHPPPVEIGWWRRGAHTHTLAALQFKYQTLWQSTSTRKSTPRLSSLFYCRWVLAISTAKARETTAALQKVVLDLLPCPSQHSALCCGLLLATRPQLTSGSQQQVLFTKHAGGGQGGGHVPCVLVVVVFDVCLCTPDCSEAPVLSPSISSCPPPRPLSPTHNPTTTTHTHTGAGLLRRVARPLLLFAPQSFHEAKPGHCLCRFLLLLLLSCSRPCLPPDQPRQSGPQAPYAAPTKGLV